MSRIESVVKFLQSIKIPTEDNNLLPILNDIGVTEVKDLVDLQENDLENSGLTTIQKRKLIRHAGQLRDDTIPQAKSVPVAGVKNSRNSAVYQFKYIFCSDLMFVQHIEQQTLITDMDKETMSVLTDRILTKECLSHDSVAVELFTHEGYPLPLNDYNKQVPLKLWELTNDALFYAFPRPKLQPHWAVVDDAFETVEPLEGSSQLHIYSELYNLLTINVNLPCTSVDIIVKKVASCVNMSPNSFSVHMTPKEHNAISEEDLVNIQDGTTLTMRVVSRTEKLLYYGKKTYTPMVGLSDAGLSKFYSILMYLVKNNSSNVCSRIVQFLRQYTSCPPLAYAFLQLHQQRCIVNLPHAVALFEGFYCLIKAILEHFCIIPAMEVLEYSDYVFGLILKHTENQTLDDISESCVEQLTCPITCHRILRPVVLHESKRVYERLTVEQRIEANEPILYCDAQGLQLSDVMPSQKHQRLLLLSAHDQSLNFHIWKIPPTCEEFIGVLQQSWDWKELASSHKLLEVCDPDALSGKSNTLTYLQDGRMVLYVSPMKGKDLEKQVYDPLCCDHKVHSNSEMDSFKSTGSKKVFRDIRTCLNPKIRGSMLTDSLDDPSLAVKSKQAVGEITHEPEEAIMVMLDVSGSMDGPIFKGEGGMTRLTAAKEYFIAFSNRIEAYGLPQVVGLISFNNKSKLEIPFTEVMDQFKDVLKKLSSGGGTLLYDATLVAIDQLKEISSKYPSCKKRILCLTDGDDTSSTAMPHAVVAKLQEEKVVVDTVLITGVQGNLIQKAVCHATGGYCFLPDSKAVAYRLFEMESFLTLADRLESEEVSVVSCQDEFRKFKDLNNFPYNSTDPYDFKSQFVAGLDKKHYCSARSMVQKAHIIGLLDKSSSSSTRHMRRILQEIRHYQNFPHPHIEIFPDQSNAIVWKLLLRAPEGTPYEGGTYLMCAKFSDQYPVKPPELRFITPIYHCNINSSGRICHPVLGRNYIPSMSMKEIFDHVYGLLMSPEPLDPLDSMLAAEFHDSHVQYEKNAKMLTEKYAKTISWDALRQELTSDEDIDVDEDIVCPLSHKVFIDPVTTQYSHTYERADLMKYLAENDNLDPLEKKPVTKERIIPAHAIKKWASKYRSAMKKNS